MLVPYEFKSDCDKTAFRANIALVTFRRNVGQFDGRTVHIFLNGFIRPHIEYGSIVFAPSPQKDKDTQGRIQRRATKLFQEPKFKSDDECF